MKIQIDPHTIERAAERGASIDEINEVLVSGKVNLAKAGRKSKSKVFEFNRCGTINITHIRKLRLSLPNKPIWL